MPKYSSESTNLWYPSVVSVAIETTNSSKNNISYVLPTHSDREL